MRWRGWGKGERDSAKGIQLGIWRSGKCLKAIKAKALEIKAGSPHSSLGYLVTPVLYKSLCILCVCICSHGKVHMCAHMCSPQVHAKRLPLRLSTLPGQHQLSLAGWSCSCLCSCSFSAGGTDTCCYTQLLHGFGGTKLRSACLWSRHFTHEPPS